MLYSITNIALIVGFIFLVFFIYSFRGMKNRAKPFFIASMTICIAAITFLGLYQLNYYNDTYLTKYMDYNTVEPIEKSITDDHSYYTFFLVYDGTKIRTVINIKNKVPYKSIGELSIFLDDYDGDILYSRWRVKDKNTINKFKKMFIEEYKTKWDKIGIIN